MKSSDNLKDLRTSFRSTWISTIDCIHKKSGDDIVQFKFEDAKDYRDVQKWVFIICRPVDTDNTYEMLIELLSPVELHIILKSLLKDAKAKHK